MAVQRKVENDTLCLYEDSTEILSIMESAEGNDVLLKLSGMLRSDVAHDFQDELVALATLHMNLILDMADITYISSTCQQVLLAVQQKIDELGQSSMRIKNMPANLKTEFDNTGFSQLLDIEE